MNRYCNCNCCNCLLFSAEELGALKTTLNDWQHHQQLETLTLEAVTSWADPQLSGNNNPLYCRQPEADSRRQTDGGRQTEAHSWRQTTKGGRHPADMGLETSQPSHSPNAATSVIRSALSSTQWGQLKPIRLYFFPFKFSVTTVNSLI